ncbi:Zn-ribbon domain-containing OB-fold protein [Saccharopolyspora sp. NPDC050642]|uniref:Zn-ribbon domain-containing OB-fold protein n=1 Tax=Saccharopolyspora sp. NPDC050642 TaxID=3157099 RepID=UPI0033CF6D18
MVQIIPDAETRPFWDGIAAGELRIQRCADCEAAVFYPRSVCPGCFGDRLDWFTASGRGTVHSWTVAHKAFGEFADQAPFTVALVDLDEGPRMLTRIVGPQFQLKLRAHEPGADEGRVRIGDRVELVITSLGADGPELPCFRVVAR